MIVDRLTNHRIYSPLGARIAAGLEYLAGLTAADFQGQTIELDGRNLYAMFQTYTTEDESGRLYEAHKRYLDIQFIFAGTETIRVVNTNVLQIRTPYDAEADIAFYDLAPGIDAILQAGDFALLYPHDAHLPKLPATVPAEVKKVVVKVKL